jgi:hypothetical protein
MADRRDISSFAKAKYDQAQFVAAPFFSLISAPSGLTRDEKRN